MCPDIFNNFYNGSIAKIISGIEHKKYCSVINP